MATLILSLLFSIIPTVLIGKLGVGAGYVFLTYLCAVVFSFIGAKIGKVIRDFANPLFVGSNSIIGLAIEKFNALYGTQIGLFILGLVLSFLIFSGKIGNVSSEAAKTKESIAKSAVDAMHIEMIPIKGGRYNAWDYKYDRERTKKDDVVVEIPDFIMSKRPVTQGLSQSFYGEKNTSMKKESFSFVEAIMFCNDLSKSQNLTPCYSIKGTTETATWVKNRNINYDTELELEDSVVCDFSANGYRLPTEVELEYVYYGGNYSPDKKLYLTSSNTLGVYIPGRRYLCWNWYTENKKYYEKDIYGPSVPDKWSTRVTRNFDTGWGGLASGDTGRINDNHYGLLFLCRSVSDDEWMSLKKVQDKEKERLRSMLPNMIFVEGGTFEKRDYKNHTSESVTVDDFYISTENLSEKLLYEIEYEFLNEGYFENSKSGERHPNVLSLDAEDCNLLSAAVGYTPCYEEKEFKQKSGSGIYHDIIYKKDTDGFRLPTEDELAYFNSKYEQDDSIHRIVREKL